MTYQVLARKWRPRDFETLVGQTHVARALINALDTQRLHHAFLFTGTRGVGKTTLARILAKCLNCETGISSKPCGQCSTCREIDEGRYVDLIEVDAASRAKVDETRDLMDNVQFAPARGRFKVYLIDEVHMFSTHSFNALLKTLEEPPPHVKFLLATTDPQKLPVTVLSRCLQFNLKRLPPDLIAAHLEQLMRAESVEFEGGAIKIIAKAADGSMRDALSLLDQAIAHGAGTVNEANVRSMVGSIEDGRILSLLTCLNAGDGQGMLDLVREMSEQVIDFESLLQELLCSLQRIAAHQLVPGLAIEEDDRGLAALAETMSPEDVQLYYEIVMKGIATIGFVSDTRSGLEMVLLRMLAFRPDNGPKDIQKLPEAVKTRASSKPAAEPRIGPLKRPTAFENVAPPALPTETALPPPGKQGASTPRSIKDWPRAIELMGLQGLARELASNCVVLAEEEQSVRLGLSPKHEYLNRKSVASQLQDAVKAFAGRDLRVVIALQELSTETPADTKRKHGEERQRAAVDALESDPNVLALQEAFDAVLDNDTIRPLDGNGS